MRILRLNPKVFLIASFVALPLFISCKDKETPVENAPATIQEATLEQKKQALQNVAPTSNTNMNTASGGAINPAHGEPGHRCDIPVGAPLSGNSANSENTPVQTIDMSQTKTIPTQTSGGAGINPPHGQPGHRCDIKVGDPL